MKTVTKATTTKLFDISIVDGEEVIVSVATKALRVSEEVDTEQSADSTQGGVIIPKTWSLRQNRILLREWRLSLVSKLSSDLYALRIDR